MHNHMHCFWHCKQKAKHQLHVKIITFSDTTFLSSWKETSTKPSKFAFSNQCNQEIHVVSWSVVDNIIEKAGFV